MKNLYLSLIVFFTSFSIFISCNKEKKENLLKNPTKEDTIVLDITKRKEAKDNQFTMHLVGENIKINWGDGKSDNYEKLNEKITHSYSTDQATNRTINVVISGENINYLDIDAYFYNDRPSFQLTAIDVTKNPNLKELYSAFGSLSQLDVSKNFQLESLDCYGNQLTQLDVKNNSELQVLICSENKLTKLDLSKNLNLLKLRCFKNELTDLDISKNSKIESISCYSNQIKKIKLGDNPELMTLKCQNNQLDTDMLQSIFKNLADRKNKDEGQINIKGNPGSDAADVSSIENKNWEID